MMIKFSHRLHLRLVAALVVLGLVAGFAGSSGASKASAAPGPAYCGALNMMHSDAMAGFFNTLPTGPMSVDAPQGNAGMLIAVGNTCP